MCWADFIVSFKCKICIACKFEMSRELERSLQAQEGKIGIFLQVKGGKGDKEKNKADICSSKRCHF